MLPYESSSGDKFIVLVLGNSSILFVISSRLEKVTVSIERMRQLARHTFGSSKFIISLVCRVCADLCYIKDISCCFRFLCRCSILQFGGQGYGSKRKVALNVILIAHISTKRAQSDGITKFQTFKNVAATVNLAMQIQNQIHTSKLCRSKLSFLVTLTIKNSQNRSDIDIYGRKNQNE